MKKNLKSLLALVLCLLMLCPAALAQDGYRIGQPTAQMLTKALMTGKMLNASVKLGMDLDPTVLGMSEEDAALLPMVQKVLAQTKITGGFALLDNGVRVQLAGEVVSEASAQSVAVTGAVDVTLDGLSIESNLISGRRVTVKWETLLALAGFGAEEISAFTEVKNMLTSMTPEELAAMVEQTVGMYVAQLQPVFEALAASAETYAAIASEWFLALPMELAENLNEEGYPPTAMQITVVVTAKDLGNLLNQLADQVDKDAALKQIFQVILAEMGEQATGDELADALRSAAAQMTDTSMPATIFLGMDEYGLPLYLELVLMDGESGEYFYGGLFGYEDAAAGHVFSAVLGIYDANGNPIDGIYAGGTYLADPSDVNVFDLKIAVSGMTEGETILDMGYDYVIVRAADSDLPAYDVKNAFSLFVNDGYDTTELTVTGEGRNGQTKMDGEFGNGKSEMQLIEYGSKMESTVTTDFMLMDVGMNELSGHYHLTESMPYMGVNALDVDTSIYTSSYNPALSAALTVIELETMSNDDMNTLMAEIENVLMNEKLIELMQVLPTDVVQMLAQ
ncbi:MAG: hypothetical protein IKU34_07430 [Clostridia bacterium]|nr:hypothetical protein [Clostridia bacterium]